MTLPTLIQQHQKQVYVTQLKKGLSIFQNMVSKIVADEGASDIYSTTLFDGMCTQGKENCEDSYGDVSGLENLVPKYIKTVKICSNSECDIEYRQAYFNNKGSYIATDPPGYKISESGGALQATRGGVKGFYSNDGAIYYFGFDGRMAYNQATYKDDIFIPSSVGLVTCIDVNGEKGPNTRGRDLFCYTYCPSLGGKLMPGQQHVCAYPNFTNQFIENRLMQNGWKMDY